MIQEIANFVSDIDNKYLYKNYKLKNGLYAFVELDENYNFQNLTTSVVDKKGEILDPEFFKKISHDEIVKLDFNSSMITVNKCFDPKKKIHSVTPFALFTKKKEFNDLEKYIDQYFTNCKELYSKAKINFFDESLFDDIKGLVINRIKPNLLTDENFVNIKDDEYVKIFFNFSNDWYENYYKAYLSDKLFNSNNYNLEIDNDTYGLSDFLNGANSKKPFLLHKTSLIKQGVNNRISKNDEIPLKLYKFLKIVSNKNLPNPLPIFIDKTELNNKTVSLYNEEGKLSFREIIKQIVIEERVNPGNYYLINWTKGQSLEINDFDFVAGFDHKLHDFNVLNLFELKGFKEIEFIKDVFQFENKIVQELFNKILVYINENKFYANYFGEIPTNQKNNKITKTNYTNCLKYRKAFYDFIYKNKREAITGKMFYDLCISAIIDDIKHDKINNGNHSKENDIKKKLNIFFSLLPNFDKGNKYLGGINMATKLGDFQSKIRGIFNSDNNLHLETDEEFAFAAGQLIYYLLSQSESSNKTHALVEPYITKHDPEIFKKTITRGINQYKHAIVFGNKKFEKLAAEVLSYECTTSIEKLLPVVLAGYFSNSLLYEKN